MTTSSLLQRSSLRALIALFLLPVAAAAQPVPDAGQVAAGAELGVFVPADSRLSTGIVGGGLLEVYATPRVGVRATVMATRSGYDRADDDSERQLRLGVDVIYNWELGSVHPLSVAASARTSCASIATAVMKALTTPSSARKRWAAWSSS